MTDEELKNFNWIEVSFAVKSDKKIVILVCSNKVNAENFLNFIERIEFNLNIFVKDTYSFQLDFISGEIMRFDSIFTDENYPAVKMAKLQQLTHITTAYRDNEHKLQLLDPYHSLENKINLN